MSKHTPLPWTPDAQYIHGPDGHRFLAVCDPADSAFICKAVNHHDELVAALQAYQRLYEAVQPAGGWQGVYETAESLLKKLEP